MTTTPPPSVITTTKPTVGNRRHTPYGVVIAERILTLKNAKGSDSEGGGEKALQDIRAQAEALGADAIVEVRIKYKPISGIASTLKMVMVSGIAVKLE